MIRFRIGIIVLFAGLVYSQSPTMQNEIFWKIKGNHAITWNLSNEIRLPHEDNLEMSGQKVAAIISYRVDKNKILHLKRDIIFPQLRVFIKSSESSWRKYRAYLRTEYGDEILPTIVLENRTYEVGPLDSVKINGMLQFYHKAHQGIQITRILTPSMTERLFIEKLTIANVSDTVKQLCFGSTEFTQEQMGVKGLYKRTIFSNAEKTVNLKPYESYDFSIFYAAYLNQEPEISLTGEDVISERQSFMDFMQSNLILKSPSAVLNTLFYFSKIRAAESIYQTKMGLVHSPGGGRYYTGVWANDQAEYSGPFFPYLGYDTGNKAALNAYLMFKRNIPKDEGHFWSSFEMEGDLTCCGSDRGDAAMIAFGASQFALTSGNKELGEELWPLIEWSLEYCEKQKNREGVILSDTDEMEGRIPTGKANLSTSCLYYGALKQASWLAIALDQDKTQITLYKQRAEDLAEAIEDYFGAQIQGLQTYKYFKEHQFLRHWICLPLVMGINKRKEGTLNALFDKLWADNGIRVEYNPDLQEPNLFWDRGTLYAFRGAFKAGAADRALEKLLSYSRTRLLGFHVPYVVEAWPEGNMAHLSAESALYCRIFTEGMLGIVPTGFHSFTMQPHLPAGWNQLTLTDIHTFNFDFDINIKRVDSKLQISILKADTLFFEKTIKEGEKVNIQFNPK